jgi:hypothetical protein
MLGGRPRKEVVRDSYLPTEETVLRRNHIWRLFDSNFKYLELQEKKILQHFVITDLAN